MPKVFSFYCQSDKYRYPLGRIIELLGGPIVSTLNCNDTGYSDRVCLWSGCFTGKSNLPLHYSPFPSYHNPLCEMQACQKNSLYLYQILDGFMGSYHGDTGLSSGEQSEYVI